MKKFFLTVIALACVTLARADEGMWLPSYLEKLNIKTIKERGARLEAEDIFSINKSSLKDAIVLFGGGCTGEIVSPEGLLFTNHHCGYGSIQALSSVSHDYLKDGYWAMNRAEELPAPGLNVQFVKSITDVTADVLKGIKPSMTEKQCSEIIAKNIEAANKKVDASKYGTKVFIKDFFGGNQYFQFVMLEYSDVRLVGAPPSSIGKFGGDTDNWMWPRHTGDFSIFRVYADKDGNPAAYSKDNVPMKSKKFLPISLKGVKDGDFAMVMGFPGRTNRFMTSYEIDQVLEQDNPIRINVRGLRQDILKEDMVADPKIKIQYASKYTGSSNYWKNSIGMSRGLRRLNIKEKKETLQNQFTEWVNQSKERQATYGEALPLIKEAVEGRRPYSSVSQYLNEAALSSVELLYFASVVSPLKKDLTKSPEAFKESVKVVMPRIERAYGNYSPSTDRKVAKVMLAELVKGVSKDTLPDIVNEALNHFEGDINSAVDYMFNNSIFATKERFDAFVKNPTLSDLTEDPAVVLYEALNNLNKDMNIKKAEFDSKFNRGHRLYIKGLTEMNPKMPYYPDANLTLRVTYGNVKPYKPADGVLYDYKTTLSGVIAKEDPNNAYDFTVPEKLKELYKAKDFGDYAENGDVPVGFIANLDITGGNSGSPVINANGELLGLAFDGNWEAMSGDIAFEPELQRCISVDIRYVLFIVDKFAGAKHLLNEMTIIK